ncbi:MAG: G/U mismatch-specific DNA glycosylase [Actinomycetota bacterium]|nr:G/U mismatch-specific DNA glycosylase [Actinomycetota bacterium]
MTEPGRARPSKEELAAAHGKTIPDVIAPGLDVLFCGINPGLYSGATGNHFARPGNRFWPALHLAGFTPRVLHPSEKEVLLSLGLGITNVVRRTTATAAELTHEEVVAGGRNLRRKTRRYAPRYLAFLGLGSYRIAFSDPDAGVGPRPVEIGATKVWLLPNPSGLNAHYQLPALAEEFARLREAAAIRNLAVDRPY